MTPITRRRKRVVKKSKRRSKPGVGEENKTRKLKKMDKMTC
jgi:hypothetical protein